ncbi:MAG: hypothetical protein JO115_21385 [Pseudonocardiales bacterium]|nr:hypothetical protein [Pseudonocardiales bacterium]
MKTLPSQVKLLDPGEECTIAYVNGHALFADQEHRWCTTTEVSGGGEPVVCTVTAPISLTLTDLTAILYHWDTTYEDLAADDTVRTLIAEAVINWGSRHLADLRADLHASPPSGADARFWAYCQQRATTVFSTTPQAPRQGQGPVRPSGATSGVVW